MRSLGRIPKVLLVLLCLFSWLVASNHCGVAALAERWQKAGDTVCAACSHRQDQNKSSSSSDQAEHPSVCCKSLHGLAGTTDSLVKAPLIFATCEFQLDVLAWVPEMDFVELVRAAHGPPGAFQVFSIDLQRCHPAIAPPFFS